MKTLYLECNMGAAGDMLMSALYEVCDQKELFIKTMNEVFAPYQVSLTAETTHKCGIQGTHMCVQIQGQEEKVEYEASVTAHSYSRSLHERIRHAAPGRTLAESADTQTTTSSTSKTDTASGKTEPDAANSDGAHSHSTHNSYSTILAQIDTLSLPEQVKKDAAAIYQLLGEAEAKVHGINLEQIHFHEVGSLDAIVDVTGCALLLYLIAPEQILASPIHVGNGFVHCAHGVLPVPAPATAELLKGIPYYSGAITGELCTPTGAAILKYYVNRFFPMPPMVPTAIGYGMGKKDFEIANCVRIFFGETFETETPEWKDAPALAAPAEASGSTSVTADNTTPDNTEDSDYWDGSPYDDTVLAISCNIDDMTGEAMGLATEIMMAAGALDVYTIPIQMKKNRPGILLTCICNPDERDKFTGLFFLHTSTRGVRYQEFNRSKLESTVVTRSTAYGDIRIKKSSGYGIEKEKPEFEDLKSVILKNGCALSLDDVTKSLH